MSGIFRLSLSLLISAGAIHAQTATGGMIGLATTDPAKPIFGTKVTAIRISPRPLIIVNTTTDPNGGFAFTRLEAGVYELCVEAIAVSYLFYKWQQPKQPK